MPIPLADATGSVTLIVALITLALVGLTLGLALAIRASSEQAGDDVQAQLELLRSQVHGAYRPLLVDVPPSTVDVAIEAGKVHLAVPLRNIGGGVAVVDGDRLALEGNGIGTLESRAVQRAHVPVNEATRIELVAAYRMHELGEPRAAAWQLTAPYADLGGGQRTLARLLIVCRGDDVQGPWYVDRVEQQSSADRAPSAAEQQPAEQRPEDATQGGDPPSRADSRRQPVTDIWGNPIEKRSRRRR